MNHVVMYSGGAGSYMTARRVADQHGTDGLILLFTDTLIEDRDLYRFLLEGYASLFNVDMQPFVDRLAAVPDVGADTMPARKDALIALATDVRSTHPQMQWIADGRDPWDVFFEGRFLGSSRFAQCSHKLKQDVASAWIRNNLSPQDTILYLGIDWTEQHRMAAPRKNWSPYPVMFPMTEPPFLEKADMLDVVKEAGITVPKLYLDGFSHNNCGGFCVRAGQGHFINLLKTNPGLYAYHEQREQEIRELLDKNVAILTDRRNNDRVPFTLRQLREQHEQAPRSIDMFDVGGCGCFVTDESA